MSDTSKQSESVEADTAGRSWFVVDHDRNDAKVRGPYRNAASACAVRAEMERNAERLNLWIVWERKG